MYSQLSRSSTARGSSTSLVTLGPTKVKACKSILFTEGIPEVEIIRVMYVCMYVCMYIFKIS